MGSIPRSEPQMIDLHCHILPSLDDGSRGLDDSVAMALQAESDRIEAVCATPHIRHDHDVRIEEVADRVEAVNARLREEGIAVEILSGGEVAETAVEDLDEEELAQVSLGSGRWILLEPAPGPLGDSLLRRVGHLADHDHRALIAHPERHLSADMFERMAALVAAGALIQATADFFLRDEMATAMLTMAEAGLVHVLSSDAHSSLGGRPLRLAPAFERLGAVAELAPRIEWMAETAPRAIVTGGPLEPPFEPSL
jgi:protein-tyrosine phosphatase